MSNKDSLMASLMGGGGPPANGSAPSTTGESDLFGDIPPVTAAAGAPLMGPPPGSVMNGGGIIPSDPSVIVPPLDVNNPLAAAPVPPPAAMTNPLAAPPAPLPTVTAPTPPPTSATPLQNSLLMQSGLLGTAPTVSTNMAALTGGGGGGGLFDEVEQEEERQQQEQQAAAAAAAAAAAEQAKQQQLLQLQQQQQQQMQQQQMQQMQDQMQSIHLGGPAPTTPGGMIPGMPPVTNPPALPQPTFPASPTPPGQPSRIPSQPGYLTTTSTQPPESIPVQPSVMASSVTMPGGFVQQQPPQQQQPGMPPYGSTMMSPPMPIPQQQHQQPMSQQPPMTPQQQQPMMQQQQPPPMMQQPPPSLASPQSQQPQQQGRYYQPQQSPMMMAGMHNGAGSGAMRGQAPKPRPVTQPPPVPTMYANVQVHEPLLVSTGNRLFGTSQTHWTYQVTSHLVAAVNTHHSTWMVRRRFRHVVALEERLRDEIPGAILPPRPDKHATRALEEASTQQSAEFAVQRAAELQVYLNQLIQHPHAHNSHSLRLFLSLQDDLGTAWPEVSNNTLTRLANASVGAAVRVSEQTAVTKFPWQDPMGHVDDYGEDSAQILAVASQEQIRMASVLQAVPKLEGAVTLLREGVELKLATGMELGRLAKEVAAHDAGGIAQPMDVVSTGMLRDGRRGKRLALELFAAMHTFSQHYRLCRYEKMAFLDRRLAIMRKHKERGKADHRAQHLVAQSQYQQQQQLMYAQQQQQMFPGQQPPPNLEHLQHQAVTMDALATDAVRECDEIGDRLVTEINRLAYQRRTDWHQAVKVVASAYKEATSERVAIWESTRESFLQAFPEYEVENSSRSGSVAPPPAAAAPPPPALPINGGVPHNTLGMAS